MTIALVLLSGVSFRDREITGPRVRNLVALLAADLHAGCATARLVEELWTDDQPENPTKASQVLVSRAQLGLDVIANTPTGYRLALSDDHALARGVAPPTTASAEQPHRCHADRADGTGRESGPRGAVRW